MDDSSQRTRKRLCWGALVIPRCGKVGVGGSLERDSIREFDKFPLSLLHNRVLRHTFIGGLVHGEYLVQAPQGRCVQSICTRKRVQELRCLRCQFSVSSASRGKILVIQIDGLYQLIRKLPVPRRTGKDMWIHSSRFISQLTLATLK